MERLVTASEELRYDPNDETVPENYDGGIRAVPARAMRLFRND